MSSRLTEVAWLGLRDARPADGIEALGIGPRGSLLVRPDGVPVRAGAGELSAAA